MPQALKLSDKILYIRNIFRNLNSRSLLAFKSNNKINYSYNKTKTFKNKIGAANQNNLQNFYRSAEHPDPSIFSANNTELRKELPLFVRKINMKFIANKDWYPSEQSKILYLVSRLKGKAYAIIAHGINRDGTIKFPSANHILVLLEQLLLMLMNVT